MSNGDAGRCPEIARSFPRSLIIARPPITSCAMRPNRTLTIGGAALAALVALGACGDGPGDGQPTPTPGSTSTDGFGPAPTLGSAITQITPAHAAKVSVSSMKNLPPGKGICFEADFGGLQESGQWFRMAVDANEVTTKLTWIVATNESPKGGTACFTPPADGLSVGMHTAAVSVQNPRNTAEPARQVVAWKFEVVP